MICSSNMNRSMQGHFVLEKENYKVESFVIGSKVRLHSKNPASPNTYDFGTPYEKIYNDLATEDESL